MRTKKTYIKDNVITRTIPVTTVTFVSVNMETMQVEENTHSMIMEYNEKEAEMALREMGFSVAGIKSIDVQEMKFSMDTSLFVKTCLEN